MSDSAAAVGIPPPPAIPGGEEVYDRIMAGIEPELVTATLATLDAKYANEIQEDRDARMERYKKAFLKYEEEYAKFVMAQEGGIRTYKRTVMTHVEKRAGGDDAQKLADIDTLFSQAA